MTTAVDAARPELVAVVGESHVASDSAACGAYAVDGRVPSCVVYPPSAEHAAAVLKWAADRDLAVIPCRNGTKLPLGNPPRRYDVALSLKQMNNVWHYEPADLTVSAEAGMKFADFQRFVGQHHLWLPLDPPNAARASLGGILAANSSGALRLRYGGPRDMVVGMKIATTEGKVIKTGGRVVKNVAGYDFSKLLIGSHGTLGVIVEASFKLYPLPAARETFVLQVGSLDIARDLRRRILISALLPLRMVLLNPESAGRVRVAQGSGLERKAHELWLEAGGSRKVLDRYAAEFASLGRELGAGIERLDASEAQTFWTRLSDSWLSGPWVALKATLPISACEEFLGRAEREAESEHLRISTLSQAGVGVLNLCCTGELPTETMVAFIKRLRSAAEGSRGALVVERCSPQVKQAIDVWGTRGDDWEVMRKLKLAWDPKGILAPGRLVGSI